MEILNDTKNRLPGKLIRELFDIVARSEADTKWQATVNIIFVNDNRMRRLNKKHRKMNRPTDVLSFNLDRPEMSDHVFGEVYISCDTARRQAKEYGVTIIEEYLRLACHGLLHLFGYDHKKPADAEKMRTIEQGCLDHVRHS